MKEQSSIPASVEALETMMMYLVEAVSRDYGISMEAAKPKAVELFYESSKKLVGSAPTPIAKQQSSTEFQMNIKACADALDIIRNVANTTGNPILKLHTDKLEFHLKKLER